MKLIWLLFAVLSDYLLRTEAITYTRCQLAKKLLEYGFAKKDLANWVCLIESESGRNSAAVGRLNLNGSKDYGLFQINSYYFCSGGTGSKYNECKVSCSALTNDKLDDDIECAKMIFGRQGFNAWYGWQKRCKGRDVRRYVVGCRV